MNQTYMREMKTCALFSRPYLDSYNSCYKNIVTINHIPKGPLKHLVRRTQFKRLSHFEIEGPCSKIKNCGFALRSLNDGSGCSDLMDVDEVPDLISFLLSNDYHVDSSITKVFNAADINTNTEKLLFFIRYNGE
jgi:hypothetical protein